MNDIKIMSRGGARLSDILPNYILKKIQMIEFSDATPTAFVEISKPICPGGYIPAISVQPTSWDIRVLNVADWSPVSDNEIDTDSGDTLSIPEGVCVQIYTAENESNRGSYSRFGYHESSSPHKWRVRVGYRNDEGDCTIPNGGLADNVHTIIQTYCVLDTGGFETPIFTKEACVNAGYVWDVNDEECHTFPNPNRPAANRDCTKFQTQESCEFYGCAWNSSAIPKCSDS